MRWLVVIGLVLAISGCGRLVDSDYPGPPLARVSYTVDDTAWNRGATTVGLLWNVRDAKGGSHYILAEQQLWTAERGAHVPLDVYSQMPGYGELGYAFVVLFAQGGLPLTIDGSRFVDPATLVAVDTTHVLLFARALTEPPAGGIVWPSGVVVDNPDRLLGPGYHLTEARCGADGSAEVPMHVAIVDQPLDRDEARPLLRLFGDTALADESDAVGGIPSGPVAGSCLVLP